eukprot:scaffold14472_cov182-Skeletonema_marinoi.AAC.1
MKHPSSQTEKLCPKTEFESYKALLVAPVKLISRVNSLDTACRWTRVIVGTSTTTNYQLPFTSTKAKHPLSCWHFNRCTLPPTSTKMERWSY